MKAFNIEADDAEHIIDSVNEVANNFAVSSADLATNLGNMSAIMAINNVSLEEQIGMLTGVTEITRNASSASRGLVMVSSRLTQVLDDTSSTGKKLTAIYKNLGIELKDENGQLRGHYEILGDLAGQWDNLSENEQKYIALTSAGARQQQNFVSLMENWGQVAKATATAYNSLGSAQKENAKVMDSIEKKVEILKSQFQQLVIGKGGLQDTAKGFLDIAIALLKFANSDIGKTIIQITAFETSLILAVKGVNTLKKAIIEHAIALEKAQLALEGRTAEEIAATTIEFGFTEAVKRSTRALIENATAFATSPFGIVVILLGAIAAITIANIKATEKYNKRLQDEKEKLDELADSAKDAKSELDKLKDSLKIIQDQIKRNNETKLKINDKNQLDALDKENSALIRQEESLKRQITLQEKKLELAQREADTQARKTLETTTSSQFKQTEMIDSFSGAGTGEFIGIEVTPQKELELAIEKYEELKEKAKELQEQLDATDTNTEEWEDLNSELEDTRSEMDKVEERGLEMAETVSDAADNLAPSLEHTAEETEQYRDELNNLVDKLYEVTDAEREVGEEQTKTAEDYEKEREEAEELAQEIEKLASSLGITATELENLRKRFDDLTLENFLSQLQESRQTIEDTSTVIDNLQSALENASKALEEYNENGYLTLDTFQGLMSINAQYLAALVNENGQLEINQTTLGNLVEVMKVAKIEELAQAAAFEIAALQTESAGSAADGARPSIIAVGNAALEAGKKASEGATGLAVFNNELDRMTGKSTYTRQEQAIINKYKDIARDISNIKVNTTAAGNAATKAGKKGASAAKQAKDATKDLNKELEETKKKYDTVIKWISKQYDKEIDKIKKAKDEAVKAEEEKIKAKERDKDDAVEPIEREIKAIEKEIKAINKQKDALNERKKALSDKKSSIIDGIEEEIDALEKERDLILDNLELQITALEELKEQRQTYWDDQIDALKKANDELKENLELQEKLDALEKAKNTKVKIYKEGQGFVYDVDRTAVANAQKALDEYLSQKAYEDELARLEALKKAEIDNYNARLKELNKYKDNTKKSFNDQIDALKDYKEKEQKLYEEQIKTIEKDIDELEKHIDALDEHKEELEEHKDAVEEAYEAEIDALNDHKDAVEEAYESEIETWQNYKQQFEDLVNAYEEQQNRLLFQQLTGITDESNNWMTRLDNLAEFVNKYNALQAQLDTGNTNVSNDANMSSGSGGGGGGSYSGSSGSTRTVTNRNTPTSQYSPKQSTKGVGKALSNQGYHGMPTNVRRYASGVDSIDKDSVAIVGENPNQEIVIGSKINNGQLMSLDKGTGVVNADSSKTLAGMLNQVGQFGASGFGSGNGTLNNNINNDSLTINGVTIEGSNINDPQTFVNGLLSLKSEALQRAYRRS